MRFTFIPINVTAAAYKSTEPGKQAFAPFAQLAEQVTLKDCALDALIAALPKTLPIWTADKRKRPTYWGSRPKIEKADVWQTSYWVNRPSAPKRYSDLAQPRSHLNGKTAGFADPTHPSASPIREMALGTESVEH
jgi:hypothetical protein